MSDTPIPIDPISPIPLQEEMENSFLDYAMSVIMTRALPDARDGLKPVHRRILYGMDQLGETTMAPETRTLQQVTMEDAFAAGELFSMLMGDQVEPRRDFIETNAKSVINLDV